MRKKPDVAIIIGSMKCGTTSLFDYLSLHPEICPSKPKEPEFFSEKQNHKKHVKSYWDLWPTFEKQRHSVLLEGSTGYTKQPYESNVAHKIYKTKINPYFIYIIRNPYDRIESHATHRNKTINIFNKRIQENMIDITKYYYQIRFYERYFSKSQIKVLTLEQLQEEPDKCLNDLFDFLNIQRIEIKHKNIHSNKTRGTSKKPLKAIIKNPKLKFAKKFYDKSPKSAKKIIKGFEKSLATFSDPNVKLSKTERDYIHEMLYDDMISLQKNYGIDVARWGFR